MLLVQPNFRNLPIPSTLPQLEMSGLSLVCNGRKHSLARKPVAFRVVRTFFEKKAPSLSSREIVGELFGEDIQDATVSKRLRASRQQNLTRMMSRIRTELEEIFQDVVPKGIRWFHYDPRRKHWVLFKMPATGADGFLY